MADQKQQPTILVKRSDGTFIRMTLDEVKRMKSEKTENRNLKSASAASSADKSADGPKRPIREQENDLKKFKNPEPQRAQGHALNAVQARESNRLDDKIKKAPPLANVPVARVTGKDFGSLLEEPLPKITKGPVASPNRSVQAESVLKKLSFKIDDAIVNRLRTTLQLYLKDIKGMEQTREVLVRSVADGGVGLNAKQTDEVIQKCAEAITNQADVHSTIPTLKELKQTLHDTPEILPPTKMSSQTARTVTPPKNEIAAKQVAVAPLSEKTPASASLAKMPVNEPMPEFKLHTEPAAKVPMHDIIHRPVEVGPVDEIQHMTLVDFRRLSSNPEEAARRVLQKFTNLREESILLYLDAIAAWHDSPLFQQYIQTVIQALDKRQKITTVIGGKEAIQLAEIQAVVSINKKLN